MVKAVPILIFFVLPINLFGQRLSMGGGARVSANTLENRSKFNFDIIKNNGDTLILKPKSTSLTAALSTPVFVRYNSNRNWWFQVDYGYDVWRLDINGYTEPTNAFINSQVEELIKDLNDFQKEELREVYEESVKAQETYDFKSFQKVQYNRLTAAIGSAFNRQGTVTFYYGGGLELYTASTIESYQGLVYENPEVSNQYQVLEAMPQLKLGIMSTFLNVGLERQNFRIGLDFVLFPGPIFGEHQNLNKATQKNAFSNQFIKSVKSIGLNVNYTLFNQNFNQAIKIDKKNVLDPLIVGRYRQKPKLIQVGLSINFPNFYTSGYSVISGLEITEEQDLELDRILNLNNDHYLSGTMFHKTEMPNKDRTFDYIYLEINNEEYFINTNGVADTCQVSTTLFFDRGIINSIAILPKLSGFVRINPHELLSLEGNVGFQNHTYGIVAYETERKTVDNETSEQTRKLVYQENFRELSLGLNAYTQKYITNISQLGFHIGLNYNLWFNGAFNSEKGGINDSELLREFHEYNTGEINDDVSSEWNANINPNANKGIFTKDAYVESKYGNGSDQSSYHMDYSPYLFNTGKKRNYFELRAGIDFYVDNLKFHVFAEKSLGRNKTMYNNLFTLGMGMSLFLN